MFFSMPIQWYHSHVDPIWPDGTLNILDGHSYRHSLTIDHFFQIHQDFWIFLITSLHAVPYGMPPGWDVLHPILS